MKISLVAALSENQVIGRGGQLPWHLPHDLQHFRQLTLGKPVIMGRTTFESLGKPLAKRLNIVLTHQPDWTAAGCLVAHTPAEALHLAQTHQPDLTEIIIGGGEAIYRAFLPQATHLYLTHVDTEIEGGCAFFPEFSRKEWQLVSQEPHPADEKHAFAYTFCLYERKKLG